MRLLVIHGPNLNLLGTRSPEIYGRCTLAEIDAELAQLGASLGASLECRQFNGEGDIVDALHAAREGCDGIILNPGAYAHYSHAIADAVSAIGVPVIEVHLSNVYARESFRRTSVVAPVCIGSIAGLGVQSYLLALRALVARCAEVSA